jgi:dipeptidyl aminopeptidase/acylaminoacyl peptidase
MTAQDLVTLVRVTAPVASADGKLVIWQQTETDPASYKRKTGLWRSVDGGAPARLAGLPGDSQTAPALSADGKTLYFIAAKDGVDQVWSLDLAKPDAIARQVSHFAADVAGFAVAPNGQRMVVWGEMARNCATFACPATAKPTGSGTLYEDGAGFVRHWDSWAKPGSFNRAFVFALGADGALAGSGIPLDGAAGSPGAITADVPTKPFGGNEDIAWAPDSQSVFFAARLATRDEPRSTNLDIWQAKLDGTAPINLTAANTATDALPTPSPDGQWLAYVAMARPGYESDRHVVMLRNLKTGQTRALTANWDRSAASLVWAPDGKALIATADEVLDHPAFRVDATTGKVERLNLFGKTREGHINTVLPLAKGGMVISRDTASEPAAIYHAQGGSAAPISHANDAQLATLAPVTATRFSFSGANGDTVWGMVYKPASAPSHKLPVVLMVHGGPQGSFGDDWSNRWNPRLWASQGYGVVTIDFHGSTGYGQAFTDAINRNWGGWPLEDLQKGLAAALAADTQLDGSRACAAGASYGGYMMNWIEGAWPERFKCIVQHDGVFDARAMAYETDELWFDEWEHGGHPYYEAPAEFEKWNPVNLVTKWQTPQLVITSQNDFRIPYTQGLAAYTALQRRGVPSQLLVFPDENHWVLKPKNSLQWHASVFGWLARWLKP